MAQLVEHHLAKVRVASSNLVVRSRESSSAALSGPLSSRSAWSSTAGRCRLRVVPGGIIPGRSGQESPGSCLGSTTRRRGSRSGCAPLRTRRRVGQSDRPIDRSHRNGEDDPRRALGPGDVACCSSGRPRRHIVVGDHDDLARRRDAGSAPGGTGWSAARARGARALRRPRARRDHLGHSEVVSFVPTTGPRGA